MHFVGIDWSDQALDYQLRSTEGHVLRAGQVKPTLEGIGELFAALEAHGAPAEFDIAVETAHGAWVQALLDRGYVVYPVNPKTADAFREALSAAGNKSDRIDAQVLAMFLAACHTQLRPLQPDDPEIITLRIACEDRLRLVHERTAKLNELRAVLKVYYPAFLACFDDLSREIGLKLLLKCPTQNALRGHTRAGCATGCSGRVIHGLIASTRSWRRSRRPFCRLPSICRRRRRRWFATWPRR